MAHVGNRVTGLARAVPCRIAVYVMMACVGWCLPSPGQFEFRVPATRVNSKVYFDASHKADADLRSGDNHAKSGNFAEAIEIYQRVIQQFGDKVVEVPIDPAAVEEPDSRLSVNARRECQRRIATLPPEARAIYRSRVDPQAERWFRLGRETRDRAILRRIVDNSFCSSWGDDALELLGDLAFQDGQFIEAIASYSQLVPDRSSGGFGLVHPDPSVDLVKIQAKKMLCRAAIGEQPPTPVELASFATDHPALPGPFAGRKGSLADDLAAAIREDHLSPLPRTDGRWPTFAGSPTRTRIAPGPVDVGSLQWKAELEPILPARNTRNFGRNSGIGMGQGPPPPPERLLGYHPIVVGDQVIVVNEKQVIAYNLNSRPGDQPGASTNAVEVAWKSPEEFVGAQMAAQRPSGLARYTLTSFGDRIYARLGPPPSSPPTLTRANFGSTFTNPSFIIAMERTEHDPKMLWQRGAGDIPLPKRQAGGGATSRNAVFEGSPVADAHNVYVAMTDRIEMTATYVACLDAETGSTRWVRYICEANANVNPYNTSPEISHRLLTLDGPALYYQTNLGAVASLDAETGSVRWLATYPWQRPNGVPGRERDINPAIVHDGLVIVAPDDAPSIYAFDATTGRLAWKTDPVPDQAKLTHLLGVAKGHLIASGDQVLWYDVKDGRLAHAWPDNAQAVQGYGRGVLAGERVYWPTRNEIHVLDQATGLVADPPIRLREMFQCEGGNLTVGDGYLIVAQGGSLVVFCQNSRLIDRYREEIARAPDQAINYYRLAQAAEAIGRDEVALTSLVAALPRARPSESIDGSPLNDAIRDHQRVLLMKLGQKAKAAKDWVQASQRFRSAADAARNDRDRFAARLELSEVQAARGEARESVATLQALLADERLRALSVDAADGHRSIRADLLIADRLAALIRDKGRDLYADFDRAASELLARGKAEKDVRLLEDVGRSYPVALVVPETWRTLGELYEESHRPGDASRAYKKLLARAPDDSSRARALLGLARSYEAQKLWVLARDAYLQAKKRFGNEPVDLPGAPGTLALLVADRLAREPFDRMLGDRGEPSVPVPLRRRWDKSLASVTRPLGADGTPPSAEAGRVFLVQGNEVRPVDSATGLSPWSRDLESEPIWVGYLADRIIAATRTRLVALTLDKGLVEWQYDLGTVQKLGNDPFAREPIIEPGREAGPPALKDFKIVGNRVFCLRGEQALLAFDGDTGQLDWSYAPSNGRINPNLLVGPKRIVLQVLKPNAIQVLDTSSGVRRAEFPRVEEEPWPRPPLAIDDEHVALVADRLTVALFDTTRGVNAWVFRETKELPSHGPPRLFGDSERLLVLHHGQNLIRLDLATGNKLWADWRLLGTEDLSERPEAIALGDDRVFVASGSSLSAFALSDGATLWKKLLSGPADAWDVALTERSVAAYPSPSRLRVTPIGVLPLVFHRKSDGEPIQRILIQAPVNDLAIRFTPRGALVATQNGLWALGDRQVMDGSKASR